MATISDGTGGGALLGVDPISHAARVTFYDPSGNPILYAQDYQIPNAAKPAGLMTMGLSEDTALALRVDKFGAQTTSTMQQLFLEDFEGTTINANRWTQTATTFVPSMTTAGGYSFNPTAIKTINTGAMLVSLRKIPNSLRQMTDSKFRAMVSGVSNSTIEFGYGDAATFNGAHSNGAYWQSTTTGTLTPMLMSSGVLTPGTPVTGINTTSYYCFDVLRDDNSIVFIITDASTGQVVNKQTFQLSATQAKFFAATALSLFGRAFCGATAPTTAPNLVLTDIQVSLQDNTMNYTAQQIAVMSGRESYMHPLTGARSFQWIAGSEPTAATLSATAASYTTLGGRFSFIPLAGANTDYSLYGFAVPGPKTLIITAIDIDSYVGGAVAAGAEILQWFIAPNMPSAAMSGANEIIPLGTQSFAASAAIGTLGQHISKQSQALAVVHPGKFVVIGFRSPLSTAGGTQTIAGTVNVEGYYV